MDYDQYTWKQYCEAILDLMPMRKDLLIQGDDGFAYIRGLIRQGVIHLQGRIPGFVLNHETVYYPQDFVTEGFASRGVKPPQSAIRDIWLVDIDEDGQGAKRFPMVPVAWRDRFKMVNAHESFEWRRFQDHRDWPQTVQYWGGLEMGVALKRWDRDWRGTVTIDPQGYTFYCHPEIEGRKLVSMFWDGLKLDFKDEERVPFTEKSVMAVAFFVQSNMARDIDKNVQLSTDYQRQFMAEIPRLFLEDKAKQETQREAR